MHVFVSITTLDPQLRKSYGAQNMHLFPSAGRLLIPYLQQDIPVGVMVGPVIPGLTNHELPEIIRKAAEHGASAVGYTMVRLNGSIGQVFENWIQLHYPDRAEKVLNQIKSMHGGKLNDSQFWKEDAGGWEYWQILFPSYSGC